MLKQCSPPEFHRWPVVFLQDCILSPIHISVHTQHHKKILLSPQSGLRLFLLATCAITCLHKGLRGVPPSVPRMLQLLPPWTGAL